ncbi:hypothetical protein [Crocosphaera sp.]|uniref:hypothetical protein n=1 Tax=Crocosphaera sp. TaxID=2729996 RepID=UPI00262C23BB|nr:hypothetical protein [Crocosphaera sp.]MDJ0582850.1 hypothetical protein [Crocosphaera sp.]
MNRFLRETWELFYWSMFCPSKLQQRMNEWCPAEEKDRKRPDTTSLDILLVHCNFRFVAQYFLLLLCLNFPLIINISIQGQGIDWLQIPFVLLVTYSASVWCFPIGLPIPLMWLIFNLQQDESWLNRSNGGLDSLSFGLIMVVVFATTIGIMGTVASVLTKFIITRVPIVLTCLVVLVVMVGVTVAVTPGMLVGYDTLIMWVMSSPLPLFILVCILVAFSLAAAKFQWPVIITAGILSFEKLGFNSLLTIPITLIFYYRLFPDYLLSIPISLLPSLPFLKRFSLKPLQNLKLLPPYTTELLWLPLPNHDRILASAFRQDISAAMETFKKMQALPLPGFQNTIKQALPQIIPHQLTTVKNLAELVSITKPEHPLLPLLVPTFYQSDNELENAPSPELSPYIKAEISIILPRLQGVARDVEAALEASNAALRERGLERVLDRLARLSAQLPALGLKPPEIKRWQPVITRWQRVIELELEEQQKQSQGEQINPFQFGNPVRLNRDYLFKGRRKFADNIVRRILNRDRPTLILYGPRRCGKTSFLYNLPRMFPSDVLPVFLDMQSAAITSSEADFCQGLVRVMYKDSKSQGVLLPTPPKRNQFKESPYTVLEDWLDEALEKLEDRQLLLNLDEFEKIGTAINEGQISLKLFDELRHLIQHYEQLGFLFSGVKTLDEIGPHWSSYFISVVPIEMLYLEPEEARELLLDPDPEFTLRYDKGIVEEVLKLTRCQPYLLQLLGAAMVTQANLNHTDTITPELLKAAIEEGFINGEPYFTNIWTEFTGESEPEILAGQNLLLNLAKGEQPNNNRDEISEKALQYMLRHHIIEQIDNQYDFEILLVKMWVKQRENA